MDIMEYLREKYPEMVPVTNPPTMQTINGIGTTAYGSRDHDPESGTYVKTLCFTFVFVPLFCLGAYRVADAQPGWFFLGKVPLSALAKTWNLFILLAILGSVGFGFYHHHANNPETIAANRLAQADQWAAEGKLGQAARRYQEMAFKGGSHGTQARAKLSNLLDGTIDQAGPQDLLEVFQAAVTVFKIYQAPPQVFAKGLEQARKRMDSAPKDALRLLAVIGPLSPQAPELLELQLPLLEKQVTQDPDNLDALSDLALIYETRKDLAKCEQLLAGQKAKLGTREGARILGQIYVSQNKFDLALPLLDGYAQERLERFSQAEQDLNQTVKRISDTAIDQLRNGTAFGFDFKGFKQSHKARQDAMVQEYLSKELNNHAEYKLAQQAIREQSRIVPVALDLGIVLLRRGQAQNDLEARKRDLERAEKTFLAVRHVASNNDEFRIFLGQVYCWMGKYAEGRKLFDEYLADKNRRSDNLLLVGNILREIGSVVEARVLAEEAYHAETDPRKKFNAAMNRSMMFKDQDDQIDWLGKSDPNNRFHQAELAFAQGEKAQAENMDQEASRFLNQALQHYAAVPESPATLNNSGLVHFALYRLSGDPQHQTKGSANLERAIDLAPRDSILLQNVADALLKNALTDVIGNAIDLKTLRQTGSFEAIGYLYLRPEEDKQWVAKVREHPGMAKARFHYERLLVLAPKNVRVYQTVASLNAYFEEKDTLANMVKRAKEADLDQGELIRQAKELLNGQKDDKNRKELKNAADAKEKILVEARKVGGATLAFALGGLSQVRYSQDFFGTSIAPEELIKLADEAHQAAPSQATLALVQNALLYRVHNDLKKQDPVYAELAKKCQRSLTPPFLIAMILTMDHPSKKNYQENQDIRRVQDQLLKEIDSFPDRAGEWNWAMLQGAHPEAALKLSQAIQKNEILAAQHALAQIVSPLSGAEAARAYWMHLMRGEAPQALAVLKRYEDQGVPLPILGK